jgi:hypothetical protein
LEYLRS